MDKNIIMAGAAFAFAGGLYFFSSQQGPSSDEIFIAGCENLIRERLSSQSSYKRNSVSEIDVRGATYADDRGHTFADKLAYDAAQRIHHDARQKELAQELKAIFERYEKPTLYEVTIRYEGLPQAFEPPRRLSVCTIVLPTAEAEMQENGFTFDLRLDGWTSPEWVLRRIDRLRKLGG